MPDIAIDENRSIQARQRFFDKQVHQKQWKDSMAGENENGAITILDLLGFKIGKDYVRQHPIGERFVIDFAFIDERIAIEIDGKTHMKKKQKKHDNMRDRYLYNNGWVALRMLDFDLHGYKGSFYKSLIREVVTERRKQLYAGNLYPIEIPNFKESDCE